MSAFFSLLGSLLVHAVFRIGGIIWGGLRLLVILSPFLLVAYGVEQAPQLSRAVKDVVGLTSGIAGLVFMFWLAAARRPAAGHPQSLRYRYARLMGMDPKRPPR